jgi:hypothetical protein
VGSVFIILDAQKSSGEAAYAGQLRAGKPKKEPN